MSRKPLPQRRPSNRVCPDFEGHALTVDVGYYPDTGAPGEVFVDTAKGGQMQAVLSDACVIISVALQHGIPPGDLAKSLGTVPGLRWDTATQAMVEVMLPASPVGTVLAALVEVAG